MHSRILPVGPLVIPADEVHEAFRDACALFNAIHPRVVLVDRLRVKRYDLELFERELADAQHAFLDADNDVAIETAQQRVRDALANVHSCRTEIAQLEKALEEPIIIERQ